MKKRYLKYLLLGLLSVAIVVMIGAIAMFTPSSAEALQSMVSPSNPQLGDTISVIIQMEATAGNNQGNAPVVVINRKQYPTFLVGQNRWRAFIPTTPLDRPGARQIQVVGAGRSQNINLQLRNRKFPTQDIWFNASNASTEGTDHEFDRVDAFKKLVTPQKFWQGALLKPNEGPISSGFGVRRYYNGVFAKDYYHRGVDYAGDTGSAVVTPAAGQVRLVGTVKQGFRIHGNVVGVDHGQGVESIFLHLSRINVKEGDFVRAGQVVGAVGSTGATTGPHLHWGFYVHGSAVDPVLWRTQSIE
jgi:murein DD-endopeptidase MepM/ murein hydrolase activator NlpD